jgi:hypothetical protein
MAIRPQKKNEKEKIAVAIDRDVYNNLKAYAAYLKGSDLGYTVQELLRLAMAKDSKFKKYLAISAQAPEPVAASRPETAKKAVA